MKILYDHQIFNIQNIGGISRYFTELINYNPIAEFSVKYSDNVYILSNDFNKYNITLQKEYINKFLTPFNFKGKGRLFRYYKKLIQKDNESISIKYLKKSDFDVFH